MSQSSCFPHLSSSINRGRNSAPGPGLALLCSHFKQQSECAKGAVDCPPPCRAVAPWGVQVWVQHRHPSDAPTGQTRGCLLKQQNPSLSAGTQGEQQAVPLFAEVCQKEKKNQKHNKTQACVQMEKEIREFVELIVWAQQSKWHVLFSKEQLQYLEQKFNLLRPNLGRSLKLWRV